MGSSSSKESKASSTPNSNRAVAAHGHHAPGQPSLAQQSPQERVANSVFAQRYARGNSGRPELPFLGLVRDRDNAQANSDRPRETRPEREARKAEKERQLRLKERERSMREEHVDGGYLVTLGTYTGPEDFDKSVVRQLQIERRLAPFWRGLNEHSNSWTEAQLVAAVRGLRIPEPDEIPPEMTRTSSQASSIPRTSDSNVNNLTVPITARSQSHDSASSANFSPSPSHHSFSNSGPTSPTSPTSSTAQLFRGRAKTLASLATGSKNHSPDLTPQEIRLPRDPNVNGQPIEAYLYKDASECPICFMYYPPYLNKTRCCDQPICSECFVQIKRPDPHPPEHEQPGEQRPPEEEAEMLVSEVASCPFCVTPEFGISYDPPPFRRGLSYAKQPGRNALHNSASAMSSSSSLNTNGRRRTMSLSATAPQVITTDRVRPDWAKKLADARAHALRRSAAATALHNAAYVLGNHGDGQLRGPLAGFTRRRRSIFGEGAGAGGSGPPRSADGTIISPYAHATRTGNGDGEDGNADIFPPRGSSRRTHVDDIEELMMMEAIRLSLAAEEERKRKEEKEAKKEAKKKAKEDKKEAKQADKAARKGSASNNQMYQTGANNSSSTWASTSMARSSSNLGAALTVPEEQVQGKGKAPAQDFAGFNPLSEPTSTLNTEMADNEDQSSFLSSLSKNTPGSASEDPQRHLEESRAILQPTTAMAIPEPTRLSPHMRQFSETPSVASSFNESSVGSVRADSNMPSALISGLDVSTAAQDQSASLSGTPPAGTPGLEPMLNFRSLAAMIGDEDKDNRESAHIENALSGPRVEEEVKEPSPTGSPGVSPVGSPDGTRRRGDSGESSSSPPPPGYDADQITPAPKDMVVMGDVDSKDIGNVNILDHVHVHGATQ